jgi:hypothetical protein
MRLDDTLQGAARLAVSDQRRALIADAFIALGSEIENASAVLVAGSFLNPEREPLDLDLMLVYPEKFGLHHELWIGNVASMKVEAWIGTTKSIAARLAAERRDRLVGFRRMVEGCIAVTDPGGLIDRLRLLSQGVGCLRPASFSRALIAMKASNATEVLRRSVAMSDTVALVTDAAGLIAQTHYLLLDQGRDGSIKHFLRRLASDEPGSHAQLIDAISRGTAGDPLPMVRFLNGWILRHRLEPPVSVLCSRTGVQVEYNSFSGNEQASPL